MSNDISTNTLLLVIIAIFIPPLAVYLKTKDTTKTIINVVLCLLLWIPGVVHGLYVALKG